MANVLFDVYKENLLGGGNHGGTRVDLDADTIKVTLIDTADDDPDPTVDEDFADVLAAARVATGTLGTITLTDGTFDAADVTLSAVSGDQSEELVIWKDTTVESTSILLARIDTFDSGMPVTPNGGDITIAWNASGIFAL